MKMKFLVGLVAALSAPLAFGASTDSDEIPVGSNVSERCDVTAVSTGVNVTVALDQTVAEMTIECNMPGLVDITFSSDTGSGGAGQQVLAGPNSIDIPYTLDFAPFNGFNPTSFDNVDLPYSGSVDNSTGALIQGFTWLVRLNVDSAQAGNLFAGTYSDTITIDVAGS